MAEAARNGNGAADSFHDFFESWLVQQDRHLEELVSASQNYRKGQDSDSPRHQQQEEECLRCLVHRAMQHYEHYYRNKAEWEKQDAVAMLNPSWRSKFEEAFLWIGGWRPSMAFHLLYSKSGLQLESQLAHVIRGLSTGDLADLSPTQLARVDELHRKAVKEEKEIAEKFAKQQEIVADPSMVELSHVVSQMMRRGGDVGMGMEDRVGPTLASKEVGLVEIMGLADDLRLRTLKDVVGVLTPIQAVHFLVAAAELHLRLHDWGKMRDADQLVVADGPPQTS